MEEVEVLDVAAVRGQAVDEVLQDALGDLAAQLVVVAEDVLHRVRLLQLRANIAKQKLVSGAPQRIVASAAPVTVRSSLETGAKSKSYIPGFNQVSLS